MNLKLDSRLSASKEGRSVGTDLATIFIGRGKDNCRRMKDSLYKPGSVRPKINLDGTIIYLGPSLLKASCGLPDEEAGSFRSFEHSSCLAFLHVEIAAFHPRTRSYLIRDSSLWLSRQLLGESPNGEIRPV